MTPPIVIPPPTQEQIDSIVAQLYSPEFVLTKQITFADQTMTFRSFDEGRAFVAGMVAASSGLNRTRYVVTNKGA